MAKISVIVNCAYGVRYLREAIESVFGQTYTDWEIVFIDNASDDGSAEIAHEYEKTGRLRYVRLPERIPLYAARNVGIDHARGEFVAFIDVDDLYEPECLARLAAKMTPDISFVYGWYRYIAADGTPLPRQVMGHARGNILNALMVRAFVAIGCILVRRSAFDDERFDTSYNLKGDFDLWIRLCARGHRCDVVEEILADIRIHGSNLSTLQAKRWIVEERRFYWNFIGRFGLRYPSILFFIAKYEFAHLIGHKRL